MKLNEFEKRLLAFCSLVILLFSYLLYDDSLFFSERSSLSSPIAELIEKRDDVRLKSSESFSWLPAHSQDKLYAFDSVFTGEHSSATIKLDDGSIFQIDNQSLIVLSMYEGKLVLDLKSGSLSGNLSHGSDLLLKTKDGLQNLKGADGKEFRFEKTFAGQDFQRLSRQPANAFQDQIIWKSPNHFDINKQDPRTYQNLIWAKTAGIKETVVEISTTPDFTLMDRVFKTKATESGIPFELPAGQYYVRLKGYNEKRRQTAVSLTHSFQMLDKKRSLLPPPILLTRNIRHADDFNFPPVIKWEPVSLAQKYRLELSDSPRFEQVIRYETPDFNYHWSAFKPGTYFVRLYSLTDQDVSEPSEIGTLEVVSRAPQLAHIPKIVIRSPGKVTGPQKVDLKWAHRGKQSGYRVEISEDGTFLDAKVLETDRGPASMNVYKPGQYHVRVFATNPEGVPISPSSNIERFVYEVRNLLQAPQLVRPFSETTVFLQQDDIPYLWLDWKPVQDAEIYRIQVATDSDFTRVIASEDTPLNRFMIANRIPYGRYYWRVKSLNETEKIDSDWSKANRFYLIHKKREIFFE